MSWARWENVRTSRARILGGIPKSNGTLPVDMVGTYTTFREMEVPDYLGGGGGEEEEEEKEG
jgi:hypothetical protein